MPSTITITPKISIPLPTILIQ